MRDAGASRISFKMYEDALAPSDEGAVTRLA